ncbi:MAG: hypothetical protein M1820_005824 [Bogoriella megaspora]|nr:MAG: hypothetical protein M1820_005824 [Bogoriella megaspora]
MSVVLDTTHVHLGHWINWSLGSVRGSTVTLTRRDGALLTAFLAMFVTFAGTRIWKIAAFGIYLSLSKKTPQDALFHQRQAILRNTSTADEALWYFLKVVWVWHKSNHLVYRKIGPLTLVSLVASVGFAVAGVFSSQVSSSMGNEVLLSGKGCAWTNGSSFTEQDTVGILDAYSSELMQDASQRAQQCYSSNTSTENCQTFIKSSIPLSITRNASCPFDRKICQSNTANLFIDTGYLDSHYDFGVNAAPEKRITSRYVTHCAPLVLEGYSSVTEGASTRNGTRLPSESNEPWMQYFYGTKNGRLPSNFMYQYPSNVIRNASDVIGSTSFNQDYTLRFSNPIDDLRYSVHQGPVNIETAGGNNAPGSIQGWFADNPVNVLGCANQIQFCNPNLTLSQGYGPLTSPNAINDELINTTGVIPVDFPWRTQVEANRFNVFLNTWGSFRSSVAAIILSLGRAALSARRTFESELASLQRAFAEAANGPKYPGMETHLWLPQNDEDREFCVNQETLQLQSFVYEGAGTGTWRREIGVITPTTKSGERLAILDLSDPGHPRFKAPQPTLDESLTGESSEAKFGAVQTTAEVNSSSHASIVGADGRNSDATVSGNDTALDTRDRTTSIQ